MTLRAPLALRGDRRVDHRLPSGCIGEHRRARPLQRRVAALAKGEYEVAEKGAARRAQPGRGRPRAAVRAAYDLGAAFAAHADQKRIGKDADLATALDLAQQAVSWFSGRRPAAPGDADTRTNLGIVRARVQAISDELRKGEGKLEVRLDACSRAARRARRGARRWLAI